MLPTLSACLLPVHVLCIFIFSSFAAWSDTRFRFCWALSLAMMSPMKARPKVNRSCRGQLVWTKLLKLFQLCFHHFGRQIGSGRVGFVQVQQCSGPINYILALLADSTTFCSTLACWTNVGRFANFLAHFFVELFPKAAPEALCTQLLPDFVAQGTTQGGWVTVEAAM